MTWFDPDGEVIEDGEDDDRGRFVQTVFAKTSRSMLRLSNLKLEDSGEYKIKVENGQHEKTETFTFSSISNWAKTESCRIKVRL